MRRLVRTRIGPLQRPRARARGSGARCGADEVRGLCTRRRPATAPAAGGARRTAPVTCARREAPALRGATTCDEDTNDEIDGQDGAATGAASCLARNELDHDDIVSIVFTATDDLTAAVPGDRGPARSASATSR